MNLDSIPEPVWKELVAKGQQAKLKKQNVASAIGQYFYDHVYAKWAERESLEYEPNLPGKMDSGWTKLVEIWKSMTGKKIGKSLKDDSFGSPTTQQSGDTEEQRIHGARLWEHYRSGATVSRFQFVVSAGGGMVLFNRMRRACQLYLHDVLKGDTEKSVVKGWKIFGEGRGQGRSDSCVVYLVVSSSDPGVKKLVSDYIYKNVKDLVNEDFTPLGFKRIDGKPMWVMDLPSKSKQQKIFGVKGTASAGGFMKRILGPAIAKAIDSDGPEVGKIILKAKSNARDTLKLLYA